MSGVHEGLRELVIVITGASSGFGKGVARELARYGATVVLAARRNDLLTDLAEECVELGGRALPLETDVSQPAQLQQLAEETLATYGQLDVWINNAGVGAIGRFEEIPLADHLQVIQTNLMGTLAGSHIALQHFRQTRRGMLINVASALAEVPAPYYSSYTASKFGVRGLSAVLRQELKENDEPDIHVCTVMPMAMDTPFFDHAANYTGHEPQPVPPLYDPQLVVDVIVRLITRPEDEVIVGSAGKIAAFAHSLLPEWTERMLGRKTHRTQMEKAPSAPDSPGSVQTPVSEGHELHAGRLGD